MTLQAGDRIPDATLNTIRDGAVQAVSTGKIFDGRKVVLFAVPGAFTPTCSEKHLPGVDPESIEVQMDKGVLSIKGERSTGAAREGERYSRVERAHGVFFRRFALPDSANPEGITANGRHGVLEIAIPKRPETTPRRIQVM